MPSPDSLLAFGSCTPKWTEKPIPVRYSFNTPNFVQTVKSPISPVGFDRVVRMELNAESRFVTYSKFNAVPSIFNSTNSLSDTATWRFPNFERFPVNPDNGNG